VTGRKGEGLAVPLSPRLSLFSSVLADSGIENANLSLSLSLSLSVCLFFSFLPLTSRDNRAFGLSDNFALSGCTSERSNQFREQYRMNLPNPKVIVSDLMKISVFTLYWLLHNNN